MNDLFFQIVLLGAASIVSHWVAWKRHIPAILFLLSSGFLLGPILGLLKPQALLGPLLMPAVSAAVAIILFEGALHLRFSELRGARRIVRRVILLGAPLGGLLIAGAAHYIAGLSLPVAVTLGCMLVVTGPTVIMPMLRQARLSPRLGAVLKWEGIVNDPIGVVAAVLALEYFILQTGEGAERQSLFIFLNAVKLLLIVGISFASGIAIKRTFERGQMPEYLKAPFVLTIVLAVFYLGNLMLHESGLIAVTVLGMTLANIRTASLEEIRRFKETITLLLVSGVFLLLTANLDVGALLDISWRSVLFIIVLLFVIRPLTIALCCLGSQMTWREMLLVGWIAPRGVVCAAMAGVLGPSLVEAGFADGAQVMPIAFGVVLASVTLHSLTIKPLAERLNLKSLESDGLIITGVHDWTLQLCEILKGRNVPVLLVDNKFWMLKKARMLGLQTYYGELLSEEAEFDLDFVKYGSLLATTQSPAYNALVCEKFGHDFGRENVFRIPPEAEMKHERVRLSQHIRGKLWGQADYSSRSLSQMYQEGWRFRVTRVGATGKDKERKLIVPEETENLTIMGHILRHGGVRLRAADVSFTPKENDLLLLWCLNALPEEDNS